MQSAVNSVTIFRFGLFEADATERTLTRKGVRVKIQEQPFRVLSLLLQHPDEVITREELRQELWPNGTYVDFDGSLNVILKKLRATLNDDPENPRFIKTVPRRGYQFIAPVSVVRENTESGASPVAIEAGATLAMTAVPAVVRSKGRSAYRTLMAAACVLLLLVGLGRFQGRKHSIGVPLDATADVSLGKSVAVLPFSNEGAGPDFDYLRYAIADDLVTNLAYPRSVAVRPFASTSRYASQPFDPATLAHFWMSYVLRFAGLLDEATKECDAALALDPGFNMLRSCAFPFVMAGDYAHAQRYISLDESFGAFMHLRIAVRTANAAAALATSGEAAQSGFSRADVTYTLFRTCLNHAPAVELREAVAKMEADPVASLDHELYYQNSET